MILINLDSDFMFKTKETKSGVRANEKNSQSNAKCRHETGLMMNNVITPNTQSRDIQMHPSSSSLDINLKCSDCEEEAIQMKPLSHGNPVATEGLISELQSAKGTGQNLSENVRNEMSSKIGADFSQVKIHTDHQAIKMSRELGAKAFTHGSDIYFNEGQYNPTSRDGKHLLAHELTHTVQQTSNSNLIQREEGTSQMEDAVHGTSQDSASGIWSGLVDRREFVPADGTNPERTLGSVNNIRISFDPANCSVTLPSKLKFEHPNTSNWPSCSEDMGISVPANQVSQATFDNIKGRYIALTNQWLNGWYKVRINNCQNNCSNQDIDINVVVEEDTANPDTTVVIANKSGRSCASAGQVTLHAQEPNGSPLEDHRIIHEAGHMALGYLDEYPVSEGSPDEESVRTDDFSMAGSSSSFRDWMQLHERHFSFVTAFLNSVLPGCNAELVQVTRPEVNFEFNFTVGGTDYQGGGYYIGAGLDLEIPLTRSRDFQLFLGAHSHVLLSLQDPDRTAFLVGARLGFQHTFGLSDGGVQWGGFGEFGYGSFGRAESEERSADSNRYGSPYFMAGGNLGYSFAPGGGLIPFVGGEAGFGSTLLQGNELDVHGNNQWFFVGLNTGLQW